tara:strand:- start:674 stop:880 length:207 start_codon:yes stop_codon:yes gene_type:complete
MSLSAKRPSKTIKEKLIEDVQDTDAPKKRLNADVEANLYKQIKTKAVMEDRSISDITRQLWIDYLSKP